MIVLLRSLGSKQIWREPSGLQGYVRDDTHSIGSVNGVIVPWSTVSCRSFSIDSLHSVGTFLLACCNGGEGGVKADVVHSRLVACIVKGLGECFLRETMSHTSFTEILENGLVMNGFLVKNGPEKGFYGLVIMVY